MLYQIALYLFAASLVLSISITSSFSQQKFDRNQLKAVTEALKSSPNVSKCNPFVDPGCYVPIPGSGGPSGCTDCAPSDFIDALRNKDHFIMPDNLVVDGNNIQLLEKYSDGDLIFSLPSQSNN